MYKFKHKCVIFTTSPCFFFPFPNTWKVDERLIEFSNLSHSWLFFQFEKTVVWLVYKI